MFVIDDLNARADDADLGGLLELLFEPDPLGFAQHGFVGVVVGAISFFGDFVFSPGTSKISGVEQDDLDATVWRTIRLDVVDAGCITAFGRWGLLEEVEENLLGFIPLGIGGTPWSPWRTPHTAARGISQRLVDQGKTAGPSYPDRMTYHSSKNSSSVMPLRMNLRRSPPMRLLLAAQQEYVRLAPLLLSGWILKVGDDRNLGKTDGLRGQWGERDTLNSGDDGSGECSLRIQ